jgi:prolyl-tRNA editing enzyme YbaK/EbsC (Cys-tRNA(Pro) deacylase)
MRGRPNWEIHYFQISETVPFILLITAGGHYVNLRKSEAIVETTLTKADAALIRRATGFSIGGVSPLVHKTSCPV